MLDLEECLAVLDLFRVFRPLPIFPIYGFSRFAPRAFPGPSVWSLSLSCAALSLRCHGRHVPQLGRHVLSRGCSRRFEPCRFPGAPSRHATPFVRGRRLAHPLPGICPGLTPPPAFVAGLRPSRFGPSSRSFPAAIAAQGDRPGLYRRRGTGGCPGLLPEGPGWKDRAFKGVSP